MNRHQHSCYNHFNSRRAPAFTRTNHSIRVHHNRRPSLLLLARTPRRDSTIDNHHLSLLRIKSPTSRPRLRIKSLPTYSLRYLGHVRQTLMQRRTHTPSRHQPIFLTRVKRLRQQIRAFKCSNSIIRTRTLSENFNQLKRHGRILITMKTRPLQFRRVTTRRTNQPQKIIHPSLFAHLISRNRHQRVLSPDIHLRHGNISRISSRIRALVLTGSFPPYTNPPMRNMTITTPRSNMAVSLLHSKAVNGHNNRRHSLIALHHPPLYRLLNMSLNATNHKINRITPNRSRSSRFEPPTIQKSNKQTKQPTTQ